MNVFPKYPEIVRLEKRAEILSVKEVIAAEKLHGTNFRVRFPAGCESIHAVEYGGRNEEFGTDGGKSFYGGRAVAYFKERPDLLERLRQTFAARGFGEVTVFGEAVGTGIQKGIRYAPPGEVVFRAFDIAVGENLVTYDLFVALCHEAILPRVPEVWRGEPSLANFDALLDLPSLESARNGVEAEGPGANVMEGVVIRSNPLLRNVFGEWLIIKHKSEAFAEVAHKGPKEPGKDLSPAADFAETFVVPGRIVNCVGRLRDTGTPIGDEMADMKHLVPAMVADLHKECEAEWQGVLAAGITDKELRGAVTKTLGRVYGRMLVERVAS